MNFPWFKLNSAIWLWNDELKSWRLIEIFQSKAKLNVWNVPTQKQQQQQQKINKQKHYAQVTHSKWFQA